MRYLTALALLAVAFLGFHLAYRLPTAQIARTAIEEEAILSIMDAQDRTRACQDQLDIAIGDWEPLTPSPLPLTL